MYVYDEKYNNNKTIVMNQLLAVAAVVTSVALKYKYLSTRGEISSVVVRVSLYKSSLE